MKKIMALVLAAMMLLACCSALAEAPEGYPEVKEGIDFGGKDVWIYDYWTGSSWENNATDLTEEEQATYDYRMWLQDTYNVKIHQIQKGDWGSQKQEFIDFVTNADKTNPELCLFILEPGSVLQMINQGLAAPWNYDFAANTKWNPADVDMWTIGGKEYGTYPGKTEPRQLLYFNKKVLTEAGIDWNTIYDLQAEGKWTWAAFEDMLKKINRDTNNDDVIDIWGLTGSGDDMYVMAAFTNGGSFFDSDENGKLQPTMQSNETIEGLTWAKNILANYFYAQPADGNWDYYKEAFKAGNIGFYIYQAYGGFNDGAELSDMADDWGAVCFPVVNEGDPYLTMNSDNITLVPNVYDEETIQKLAFIYDMFTNPTPGYEDEDTGWIGNKYNFTDERAVDETYATLREPGHSKANKVTLLGTQNDVLGNSLLWALGGSAPADLIDAGMPTWKARCAVFNGDMTQEEYDAFIKEQEEAAAAAAAAEAEAAEGATEGAGN